MKILGTMSNLESSLAERFGRKHCVLVGSGTTALYCVFQALGLAETSKVLYPDVTCETAVNAAVFAGLNPVFCDVTLASYNLTKDTLGSAFERQQVAAVVPTHIFGHPIEIRDLKQAIPADVPVIEDAAQGYGGTLGGELIGSFGLASIVSFGPGKAISCEGGGAVLTDDPGFAEACQDAVSTLPSELSECKEHRAQLMREMMTARRNVTDFKVERQRILRNNRHGYLSQFQEAWREPITQGLSRLSAAVAERNQQTQTLDALLGSQAKIVLPERQGLPMLWRYAFRVADSGRDELCEQLRGCGLGVTTLFPPCHRMYLETDEGYENASGLFDQIVNVLFTPELSDELKAIESRLIKALR